MKKFLGLFVLVSTALFIFGAVSKKADAGSLADRDETIDPVRLDLTKPEPPAAPIDGREKQRDIISGKSYRNE